MRSNSHTQLEESAIASILLKAKPTTVVSKSRLIRTCLVEDQQELPEGNLAIAVFIDLCNHCFQSNVRLRSAKFLHHVLQFHEVDKVVFAGVELSCSRSDDESQ